jgi:anti-sigma regulatory factor (Ser/Thr protein kinase)
VDGVGAGGDFEATSWKLPDEVTETAVLLLSELVTNAYRHAEVSPGREIWTRCVLDADRLHVSVTDANGMRPTPREASLDEESGRGLWFELSMFPKQL